MRCPLPLYPLEDALITHIRGTHTGVSSYVRAHRTTLLFKAVFAAMAAPHLELPGACEAGLGVSLAAGGALAKRDHRIRIEQDVLGLIDSIPQTHLLLSMSGIDPTTAARILMTVGDSSNLQSAS